MCGFEHVFVVVVVIVIVDPATSVFASGPGPGPGPSPAAAASVKKALGRRPRNVAAAHGTARRTAALALRQKPARCTRVVKGVRTHKLDAPRRRRHSLLAHGAHRTCLVECRHDLSCLFFVLSRCRIHGVVLFVACLLAAFFLPFGFTSF
jgi:hypothetical protein